MQTLSLCLIVRDESRNLPRSLAPLMAYVDEAVVVDTGSQDGTPELAASWGARVFHFPWQDDFSQARNFSLDQAECDWIMWLDADNRLPEEDARQLKSLVQRPREAILWATEIVEPGGGRLWQKRLFPRLPQIRFRYRVHEQLCHPPDLAQVLTPVRIYHWGYEDRRARQNKSQRNLAYLLLELAERPDDFYVHYHLARHYFFASKFSEALVHLGKVLATPELAAQNPEIPRHARILSAQCRGRLGDPAGAARELEEVAGQYPDYGLAWFHLGMHRFGAGDLEGAVHGLNRFLELGCGHLLLDQPEDKLTLNARLTQAHALRQLGRQDAARLVLEETQRLFPEQPAVWLESAVLARAASDLAGARRALKTCLRLRPDLPRAQRLLQEMSA
ncbi:MAG: glycosyltransferase [Thermodesulfobacteriota bacterium]